MRQKYRQKKMRQQPLTLAGLVLCAATAAPTAAYATHDKDEFDETPCSRSARDLFAACRIDSREEKRKTIANCRHISDWTDRFDCKRDARATVPEDLEECGDQYEARVEACEALGEFRYDPDPLLDPANEFVDPDDVGTVYPANPYVSVVSGRTLVLRAGEDFEELIVIHVNDDVRDIQGVPCRIVTDVVLEVTEDEDSLEYEPVEVTDDWFAQTTAGDVFYCGETANDYEDGVITSIDGSFESGKEFAKAGLLIPAAPRVGHVFRTEFALDEAEDIVEILALNAAPDDEEGGENPALSCADNGGCLRTLDSAPLDPESTEYKYYLPGVGFVLAVALEDGEITGEREELVCWGDSLEILESEACGIEDPHELLEELCELRAEAFCD